MNACRFVYHGQMRVRRFWRHCWDAVGSRGALLNGGVGVLWNGGKACDGLWHGLPSPCDSS
eukprot:3245283-Prorocentrum_lima.AAC.1